MFILCGISCGQQNGPEYDRDNPAIELRNKPRWKCFMLAGSNSSS